MSKEIYLENKDKIAELISIDTKYYKEVYIDNYDNFRRFNTLTDNDTIIVEITEDEYNYLSTISTYGNVDTVNNPSRSKK